ncbi:MAG: hypothetical protein AB1750_03355, partial [Chloroflexota bacterium]
ETTSYWRALLCLLLLAFVVHWTADKVVRTLDGSPFVEYVPAAKGLVFLGALIILSLPIAADFCRIWRNASWREVLLPLAVALGVSLVSLALTFQPGPLGLGVDYSLKSQNPFVQFEDWQSTRLLMPALSYSLFLRGTWPFYGFFLALTVVFIAALYAWFQSHAKLSWWEFLSLCTVSFVSFQFQVPGYPDVLAYLLFLLVMGERFGPASKLSLLILALIANESSIFVGVVLAWRYLPRKERWTYLFAIGLYVAVWVALSNFDVGAVLASRNVDGMSGLAWVAREPGLEAFGLFMGYKALWAVIVWGGAAAWRSGRRSEAWFILAAVGAAVLMTFSAVDTSRLMGYAFPALLVAIEVLKGAPLGKTGKTALASIFALNLLIPSAYVGLNAGVKTFRGLYGRLYEALARIW